MTEFLTVDGGTLAYEVTGAGPLVVLAHGMGDTRRAYDALTPALVAAGHRVAALDLRGCGESSVEWGSYTRTDIAGDLLALVRHLGGPAVLVGHSISGGAATIAAATAPELVTALVELTPFTRAQKIGLGDLRVARFRRGRPSWCSRRRWAARSGGRATSTSRTPAPSPPATRPGSPASRPRSPSPAGWPC